MKKVAAGQVVWRGGQHERSLAAVEPAAAKERLGRWLGLVLGLAWGTTISLQGQVLITSTWQGGAGYWTSGSSWNTAPSYPDNVDPNVLYNAVMSSGSATLTKDIVIERFSFSGGAVNGYSLTANAGIALSGTAAKYVSNLILNNAGPGTWSGPGALYLNDSAVLNNNSTFEAQNDAAITRDSGGGTFNNNAGATFRKSGGSGNTTINSQITFNNRGAVEVNSGVLQLNGGTLNAYNGSSFTGLGATRVSSGTLNVSGTIHSANLELAGGTLTGSGTFAGPSFRWTSGSINPGTLTVAAETTLTLSGAADKHSYGRTFENWGVVAWGGGHFYLNDSATMNNYGLFDAQADYTVTRWSGGGTFNNYTDATFRKSGGPANTTIASQITFNNFATVEAATGTVLFNGATVNLYNGSRFVGDGVTKVTAGVLNLAGEVESDNLELAGGTLTGTGTIRGSSLRWTSGPMQQGTLTLAPGTTLSLEGTADKSLYNRTFNNQGTVAWAGGHLYLNDSTVFNNTTLFDAQADYSVTRWSGGGTFNNNAGATFRKSGGAGNTTVASQITFNQRGAVEVASGTLVFGGATLNLYDGSTFTGPGLVKVTSGTLNLAGAARSSNLELAGATLTGTGTLLGPWFRWASGPMNPGTLTLDTGTTMWVGSTATHLASGRTIENLGTINWTEGHLYLNDSAAINNSGLFDAQGNYSIVRDAGGGAINNQATGIFRKSAGGGTTTVGNLVALNNAGALEVRNGLLVLAGGGSSSGTFDAALGTELQFSGGAHTWQTGASFTGAGWHRVNGGTINVGGNAAVDGNLELRSGSVGGAGTLTVSGRMDWTGGSQTGAGATVIDTGGVLNLSGTGTKVASGRTLNNSGTGAWSGGSFYLNDSAVFNNSGVFEALSDNSVVRDSGGGTFNNNSGGVLVKNAGLGNTTLGSQITFNHRGVIEANSGTINFAGATLNVYDGSSFIGDGGVTKVSSGVLNLAGTTYSANLQLAGGTLTGSGTIRGPAFEWVSGPLAAGTLSLASETTMSVSGTGSHVASGRTVNNAGTIAWLAGNFYLNDSAAVNNSGLFDARDNGSLVRDSAGGAINNAAAGVFRKSIGTGTTTVGSLIAFNNDGLAQAVTGTLSLAGGGSSAGTFEARENAVIAFTGGTHLLQTGGTLTGPGWHRISGGTLNANGDATVSGNLELQSGVLGGGRALTVLGRMDWTGGTQTGAGATVIDTGGVLNLSGSGIKVTSGRTLNNFGTGAWSGGSFYLNDSAVFNNSGVFEALSDNSVVRDSGGGTFNNNSGGVFRKSAGPSSTTLSSQITFNNRGAVEANSGTINFAGATLNVYDGSSFIGEGGVTKVSSGVLNLAGTVHSANLELAGGTLTGSGTVTGPSFRWTSGPMNPGTLTVAAGGALNLSGTADKSASGRTFNNLGTMNWSGGTFYLNDSSALNNSGLFEAQADNSLVRWSGSGAVNNQSGGVFRKSGGAGTTTVGSQVPFSNAGLVEVRSGTLSLQGGYTQTAGATRLAGGVLSANTPLNLSGGSLTGAGTVNASVNAGGTIAPGSSAGTLVINGNLSLSSGALLTFELGGLTQGSDYDYLDVNGSLSLNGGLSVSFLNGFQYSIRGSDTFTLVTANGPITGSFLANPSGSRLTTTDNRATFLVSYGSGSGFGADRIVLSDFIAVPEPASFAVAAGLLLAGFAGLRRWRR